MKYEFKVFNEIDTWSEFTGGKRYWFWNFWKLPDQIGLRVFGIYFNLMWREKEER